MHCVPNKACTDLLQWSVPGGAGAPTHRYQYQGGLVHLPIGNVRPLCTALPLPHHQGPRDPYPSPLSTRGGWPTYPSAMCGHSALPYHCLTTKVPETLTPLLSVPGGAGAPTHRQCAATLHCLTTASPLRSQRPLPLSLDPSLPAPWGSGVGAPDGAS